MFNYVFKPFGLHLLESGQLLLCLGYGLVTFVTALVYEFFVVWVLKIKRAQTVFTFGRWIVYMLGVLLMISLANFLFVRLIIFGDIQWGVFPYMVRGTFAIGVFPVVIIGVIALLKQEQKYQNISHQINQNPLSTKGSNQRTNTQIFGISSSQIRYIEAMQNYINIAYVNQQGELSIATQRATLKSLTDALLGESLIRCHRSYIVNRDHITATSGNAQGLLISLADCEQQIPVSRSFVSLFRAT